MNATRKQYGGGPAADGRHDGPAAVPAAGRPSTATLPASTDVPRIVAVLDMGATAVRMAIAEILPRGRYRTLESLQQSVSLGSDTFNHGVIGHPTTEACVRALRNFRQVLAEYRLAPHQAQVRAIATSAVREALNRETFLDRISLATGFDIAAIDEAEASHYTFLGVRKTILQHPLLRKGDTLLVDVGGGSTEVLLSRSGAVVFSATYGLGALRIRERLDDVRVPAQRVTRLIESQIQQTINLISRQCPIRRHTEMLALGPAVQFAAAQGKTSSQAATTLLETKALRAMAEQFMLLPVQEIVRRHHLSLPDAETLGPALLAYTRLADALAIKRIVVARSSLRDGLLAEMADEGRSSPAYIRQVLRSARMLAEHYRVDSSRAEFTRALSSRLFKLLQQEHGLSSRAGLLLETAALLADVGLYVSNRSHHKHTLYLVSHSDLFGLSAHEKHLVALIARYHRKAMPQPAHAEYQRLPREDRLTVCKLSALLRVADALAQGALQDHKQISCSLRTGRLLLKVRDAADVALEQLALQERSNLFFQVYGMEIVLSILDRQL